MMLLKKNILVLLFCGLALTAFAQHRWQIGPGMRYAANLGRGKYPAQPLDGYTVYVNLERIRELPRSTLLFVLHTGYRKNRSDGRGILIYPYGGIDERLRVDNIILGGGLQLNLLKECRYRPFIGGRGYVGIPLRVNYRVFNPRAEFEYLPAFYNVESGAYVMTGADFYIGLETNIDTRNSVRLKWGSGTHLQRTRWRLHDRHPTPLRIIHGAYWWGGFEFIHKLRI